MSTNDSNESKGFIRSGGWLVYVALAICPVSKIIAFGLIGGSITAAVGPPWLAGLVLVPAVAGTIVIVRRARRRRALRPELPERQPSEPEDVSREPAFRD